MTYRISILFYFVCQFSVFSGYSQTGKKVIENLEWDGVYSININGTDYTNVFHSSNGYWDFEKEQPYLLKYIPISNTSVDFNVTNTEVIPLTSSEMAIIDVAKIKSSFDFKTNFTDKRKKFYAVVEVNEVRKNPVSGQFEKLVSYEGSLVVLESPSTSSKSAYLTTSAFASGSGEWYKVGVVEDGVYKIDYAFLNDMGVDVSSLNSDAINVFGNGSGLLSENNNDFRNDDVLKNSIFIEDGNDGVFNNGDYLLFYAKGPHRWSVDGSIFSHKMHEYCDTSYYFVNINNVNPAPKRMEEAQLSSNLETNLVTTFIDYDFIEEDDYNLGKSGKQWFGDIYDVQTSYNYSFSMPNIVNTDSIRVYAKIIGHASSSGTSYSFASGGNSVDIPVGTSGTGTYSPLGKSVSGVLGYVGNGNSVDVQITYNKNGLSSSKGWLDYLEVNVPRALTMIGSQMEFRDLTSVGLGNVSRFSVGNVSDIDRIWEVTDLSNISIVNFNTVGPTAEFKINTDSLRTFIALGNALTKTPVFHHKVLSQNLHGLGFADLIIIVPQEYMSAAIELASFHQENDELVCHVVTPNQIYNEYSSGIRDATAIKHFLRMFYVRAGVDPNLIPRYCLFFGDATYDPRNRLGHSMSLIPTYESTESLSITGTYATDDYFAILSDNGAMNNYDLMDIAIGRLPISSLSEANDMVAKIKGYSSVSASNQNNTSCSNAESDATLNDWRNIVCLISDDEDGNVYFKDTEEMADTIRVNNKSMNIVKLHMDAFLETTTPGGDENKGCEGAIQQRVEKGAFLVNYIGHGGETGWAHERILRVPTIRNWSNGVKLPIFMTATCEFSRYDDHDRTSGGEYVLLNPDGGGIALFTTTRLVYNSSNKRLNKHFHSTIYDKVDGMPQRIGDVYLETKDLYVQNGGGDVNFRKFALLGDPAVRLALPQHQIVTDSINGVSITAAIDTMKALSVVNVVGHIEDFTGQNLTSFNGVVYPTIYDKKLSLATLGNSSGSALEPFETWKNVVYKGKATVLNGVFEFSFVVPQDISFQYGNSRVSYYAENGEEDAQGYNEDAIIGGIDTAAISDGQGPDISLYMNDDSFVSGGITDENPDLFAKVFDENGINMVGNGVGHNIEAVIDQNTSESIILNDFYEADLDTYKSGRISYPFYDLEEGNHTLSLKVWDVYNNSEKTEIEFVVAKEENFRLEHVLNYPNPFTTRTEFYFEHNQLCDYLDVQIQVFTVSGKLVKSINERVHSEGFRSEGIVWNGRDDYGEKIGRGVYVYKLKVLNESGEKVEKFEKLVILN
ncbi:type IX secretion system sortase PorU [Flavobacteriales bacterium]|nr:type IX secretion system sortase PorU [Flavobacteriales bacterium]